MIVTYVDRQSKKWYSNREENMTAGRKKTGEVEKEDNMTYADMFSKVKGMLIGADVSDIHEHLAYQFNITGEAEGIFYAEVKDGQLYVEPYEYFERDAMFTCSAETLFKIADGKTDPILAVTLGKLKVEGNIDKALRLKDLINSKKNADKAEKKQEK